MRTLAKLDLSRNFTSFDSVRNKAKCQLVEDDVVTDRQNGQKRQRM